MASTDKSTEEENKELLRRLQGEVIDEGNLDLIDELFADDYVGHQPGGIGDTHGPEGYKELVSMIHSAFPNLDATVEDIIAEGDKAVMRTRVIGTHEGEFMGIEPTGKEVETTGIDIYRIEDGKFVEGWEQADMMGLMQQLGIQ